MHIVTSKSYTENGLNAQSTMKLINQFDSLEEKRRIKSAEMTVRLEISQIILGLVATLMLLEFAGENLKADLVTNLVHFPGLNLQNFH